MQTDFFMRMPDPDPNTVPPAPQPAPGEPGPVEEPPIDPIPNPILEASEP